MLKVLLIDDDEFTNELDVYLFKTEGATVDVRTSGVDALEYLEVCKIIKMFPDILIVDLYMPGINGFSFLKHYETHFRNDCPDLKIYILSSAFMQREIDEALSYDFVEEFLSKPLTSEKIKEIVKKAGIKKDSN